MEKRELTVDQVYNAIAKAIRDLDANTLEALAFGPGNNLLVQVARVDRECRIERQREREAAEARRRDEYEIDDEAAHFERIGRASGDWDNDRYPPEPEED